MPTWAQRSALVLAVLVGLAAAPGASDPAERNLEPVRIGTWVRWEGLKWGEGAAVVCQLASQPFSSLGPASERPQLTVERQPGGRVSVKLSRKSGYPPATKATLSLASASFAFSRGDSSAVAEDSGAVVSAMQAKMQAVARIVYPDGKRDIDTYSLRSFQAAYRAIEAACP